MEKKRDKTKEIDVVKIISTVWSAKRTMIKFCVMFFIIGVVVALNHQREYTTTVVLAPESTDASGAMSKLGSVGSLLGFKMSSAIGNDAIYPQIYPDIFASSDFIVSLFDVPVSELDSTTTKTYYNHLAFDGIIPFWSYPRIWISKLFEKKEPWAGSTVNPFRLTKKQSGMVETIKSNISCIIDKKTDVISISVTDIDPLVSATMADTVMTRLQNYITDYRTSKARRDLDYITEMYNQCEADYKESQTRYAEAADAYHDVIRVVVSSKIDELENDMQLKYQMFTEAAQQLQLAKQQVQEKTPAFTVIQNATIPIKPSSTPKLFIVALFLLIGVLFDALWVCYIKDWWQTFRRNKKKSEPQLIDMSNDN